AWSRACAPTGARRARASPRAPAACGNGSALIRKSGSWRYSSQSPESEDAAMSDLVPLVQAHCIPRRGNEHRLVEARVRELLPQLEGWALAEDGKALVRTFGFK